MLFFGLAFLLGNANAQPLHPGRLTGIVKDNLDKPLKGVTVTLLNAADSSVIKGAVTNDSGVYRFRELNYGRYIISVTAVGLIRVYSRPVSIDKEHREARMPAITLRRNSLLLDIRDWHAAGQPVSASGPYERGTTAHTRSGPPDDPHLARL